MGRLIQKDCDGKSRLTKLCWFGRLARQRRAATALEFAIIGSVFFILVFGILIVSVNLFWQLTLDDAVRNATRQVQIGKVTTGADFVTSVCSEFGVAAPNCTGSLQYSVQGGPYFGTGGIVPTSFGSNGNLAAPAQFTGVTLSSSAGAVFLLVQVAYPLPFTVLLLPPSLATENGTSSLYSVASLVMVP
ncbi:MAG: pilus assembly protein [Rhodospirillales bacterium]|nr:pilus assembly protein [Rhodospirillales bacterium]